MRINQTVNRLNLELFYEAHERLDFPECDARVYLKPRADGKPSGVAFQGKRSKSDWNLYFRDADAFHRHVNAWLDGIRASKQRKAERLQRAKVARQLGHGLEVGDLLAGSWGYDQTNWDLYQVVWVKGATIGIQEVLCESTTTGWAQEDLRPVKDQLAGPVLSKRPTVAEHGVSVRLHECCSLHKADWGRSYHQTSYA